MGADQSKQALTTEKLVIDRLRALQVKEQADNEYVHIDEKAVQGSSSRFKAPWTSLSTAELGDWEHELLQDPKNR